MQVQVHMQMHVQVQMQVQARLQVGTLRVEALSFFQCLFLGASLRDLAGTGTGTVTVTVSASALLCLSAAATTTTARERQRHKFERLWRSLQKRTLQEHDAATLSAVA